MNTGRGFMCVCACVCVCVCACVCEVHVSECSCLCVCVCVLRRAGYTSCSVTIRYLPIQTHGSTSLHITSSTPPPPPHWKDVKSPVNTPHTHRYIHPPKPTHSQRCTALS
ncbi:unnamed protein product [Gadus morhua 'NCC']